MKRAKSGTSRSQRLQPFLSIVSRGVALFFGLYSVASAVASARSADPSQNLWWIDLRWLPAWVGLLGGLVIGASLIGYAWRPRMSARRRALTSAACLAIVIAALRDATVFYRLWGAGSFDPQVPMPFSALIAVVFAWLGWRVWNRRETRAASGASMVAVVAAAVAVAIVFPLAQIAFFGSTDYRAPADAVVVLGARVYADGSLSGSLFDRMNTGVGLYRSGLVDTMVLSGGRGASGIDEPEAMRAFAISRGVPSRDIVLDHTGVDTDATVRATVAMRQDGNRRLLVVSQGYHLPRVKLAYRAEGVDVRTVPAAESLPIPKTPYFMAREIPAFWTYLLRAWIRDVLHGS